MLQKHIRDTKQRFAIKRSLEESGVGMLPVLGDMRRVEHGYHVVIAADHHRAIVRLS